MNAWAWLPWFGPVAALAARAPIGEPARALAALAAVLLGPPLAAWPFLARTAMARRAPIAAAALAVVLPQLALMVAGLAGIRLPILLAVFLGALVLAAIAGTRAVLMDTARPGTPAGGDDAAAPADRLPRGPLLATLALTALVAGAAGTPLGPYDDALDHLATIRHVAESGRVEFPGAFYGRDQPEGQDIRKGVMHLALALAVRLSDVDAAVVWRWAATLLAPMSLAGFLALLSTLAPGRSLPVWLALPAWLFVAADPTWLFKSAYGGHAGLALAWATIAGCLAGWGAGSALLAGAALAAVHAYAPAQAVLPLLGWAVVARFRPAPTAVGEPTPVGPAWRTLIALVLGALLVEAGRLLVAAPSANPLSDRSMPWLMLPFGPIASPLQLLDWYGYAGVAAALGVVLLVTVDRGSVPRYLAGTLIAPMFLLVNPWLFAPVGEALGSVANKVALVWSPPLAWLLLVAAATRSGARPAPRIVATGAALLVMLVVLPTLGASGTRLALPAIHAPRSLPPSIIAAIDRVVPADGVIASDPITSYAIPAMTGRRVIVTLHQHAPPGDRRADERLATAAALGATCVQLDVAAGRCQAEGAGWILVDERAGPRIDEYGAHRDPRNQVALAAWFGRATEGIIEPVASADGLSLFRIVRGEPTDRREPLMAGGGPPPWAVRVTAGDVELAVAPPGERRAVRGSDITFAAWWQRTGSASPRYREVQAHLRLEHERVGSGGGPFSKLRRRLIVEPRLGGSLRARGVELPFRGLCPVAEWPAPGWLGDSLQIIVPQYIVPGRYRVQLSLEQVALYPIMTPADLFSDDDRYEGPDLGWMIVE